MNKSPTEKTKAKIAHTLRSKPETYTTEFNGQKFGRLTVIKEAPRKILRNGEKARVLECKCECGKSKVIRLFSLRKGNTISCGCYATEVTRATSITHGMSGNRIRNAYSGMKSRCDNPNNQDYAHYGGRGIAYCDKWKTFVGFYEDMQAGYQPGLSIDRKDTNGPYSKENCRWATQLEQQRNRRNTLLVEYQGETLPLTELCERLGLLYHTIYQRIKRYGMQLDAALTK